MPTPLLERILSCKDRSPLITILDDSSQSARSLLKEFVKRANQSHRDVIYIALEDSKIPSWMGKTKNIRLVCGLKPLEEIIATTSAGLKTGLRSTPQILKDIQDALSSKPQASLVIVDCINPFFLEPLLDPIHFLGSILSFQPYTVIVSHHSNAPLPSKFPHYPTAQPLLSHISTTVMKVSSFDHDVLRFDAESKARPNPIEQDLKKYGVVSSLGCNSSQKIIIELELRKKSGQIITEKYSLEICSGRIEFFGAKSENEPQDNAGLDFGTTFNLGITPQQKESKEVVVLPHFSAQKPFLVDNAKKTTDSIEYTLEMEDDFDDEEDVDEDLLI